MNPDLSIQIAESVAERDTILVTMNEKEAKRFVAKHGGKVDTRLDWERVLHLARIESISLPIQAREESRIWLAMRGENPISMRPEQSPYVRAVLSLIFPKDLTDAYMALLDMNPRKDH